MGIIILFVAFAVFVTLGAKGGPVLYIPGATYEGVYNPISNTNIWYGIRYAQAPVGALRWQPPQAVTTYEYSGTGLIDATLPGPECVQGSPYWKGGRTANLTKPPDGSEDCLLLNIQKPAIPASNSLPILIDIHGGGYIYGNAQQQVPDALFEQSNGGFIYVAIQHRLGVYGFLSGTEVKQYGVANAGLLDQRAAMEWVQRNAPWFGGDPNRITITGGSAGGGSVANQMIMWGGLEPAPFQAVISEFPWMQTYKDDATLEQQYNYLLDAAGCGDIACLRTLDADDLAIASEKVYVNAWLADPQGYGFGDFYFGPSVDGEIIQDLPSNEFQNGHFTKVPLLVDREGYEGASFSYAGLSKGLGEIDDIASLFPSASIEFIIELLDLQYPQSAYNSTYYRRAAWYGDYIIDCPTAYMAAAVAEAGLPAYKLLFYAGTQLHEATSTFLFTSLPTPEPANYNATIGLYMRDWFLSFVIHFDPNMVSYSGLEKPYWPTYEKDDFLAMDVNYTQIGVVRDFDTSPQCAFFRDQNEIVRN